MVGKLDVQTLAMRIGEPRQETEASIEAIVDGMGSDDVLFLVDLEGSTPYNLCCKKCGGKAAWNIVVKQNQHGLEVVCIEAMGSKVEYGFDLLARNGGIAQ